MSPSAQSVNSQLHTDARSVGCPTTCKAASDAARWAWPGGTFRVCWWRGPPRCCLSIHWHCHSTPWRFSTTWRTCMHLKFKKAYKVQHTPFYSRSFFNFMNAFFGSQISPLCSCVCIMLMSLTFRCVILHFIGFRMLVCPYSSDFSSDFSCRVINDFRLDTFLWNTRNIRYIPRNKTTPLKSTFNLTIPLTTWPINVYC